MQERKSTTPCASDCIWLEQALADERARLTEEHVALLAKHMRIPESEARVLLTPDVRPETDDDYSVSDVAGDPTERFSGVRPVSLVDPSPAYIGDIHTGDHVKDVAARLKWLRNHSGMLKSVILNNLGVPEATLDSIESGRSIPSQTQLIILADLYNVKVDEILKK